MLDNAFDNLIDLLGLTNGMYEAGWWRPRMRTARLAAGINDCYSNRNERETVMCRYIVEMSEASGVFLFGNIQKVV